MSVLLLLVLILAAAGGSDASWCVCRSDADAKAIQKTLDYACGAGADCLPIHQKGPCFEPDTVTSHCSYAANSFFQRNAQQAQACDFSGTASITDTDPSYGSCAYPSTPSAAGTSTGTSTTPPSSSTTPTTPTTTTTPPFTTPTSSTPNNFTPATGVLGGGVGPSGTDGITADGTGTGNDLRGGEGSRAFFLAAMLSLLALLIC